jgi:betaine reductase
MTEPFRVVHFLNQFFAGVGGEEKANSPVEVREGAIGPGRALQQKFGDRATIVATVFSGDNWFTENPETATAQLKDALDKFKPDVVIAGPAFNAGRYGLACGDVCATAGEDGIPSVTAMFPENPGVLEYDTRAYIIPTGTSPADSPGVFESLVRIALKLASGESLGPAETEGYMARGIRRPGLRQHSAARRAVDMLVTRMTGGDWSTELPVRAPDAVTPANSFLDMNNGKIGLVTTGGLVPKGNPDRLVRGGAKDYLKYSIDGLDSLRPVDWESVHRGFYTLTVNDNPNYVLPLNIVRDLEKSGVIGSVHPWFYTTSGVGTAVAESKKIGAGIAAELLEAGVDAALLVAT